MGVTVLFAAFLLHLKSGVDIANVLALPVAVLGICISAWGARQSSRADVAERELAEQVRVERERFKRQALADSGDPQPADVNFRAVSRAADPELVRWRSDKGAESGNLLQVARYYRSLARGRLVVLGEPGSGKTVLATQLVLDLIETCLDPGSGEEIRVPVWLSLSSFELGDVSSVGLRSGAALVAELHSWMALELVRTYNVPKDVAEKLVREHRLLPVLDGLDEMDSDGQTQSARSYPRAQGVIRALNSTSEPVVLVCRRADYVSLAQTSAPSEEPVLQDAQQIVLQPLSPGQICDHILHRFSGADGRLDERWSPIVDVLRTASTGSVHPRARPLLETLSNPLHLFLAVTSYRDDWTDPSELLTLSPAECVERLLAGLLPAVSRHARAFKADSRYDASHVEAWLKSLAVHLRDMSASRGWSSSDLRLDTMWPIAGWRKPRYLAAAVGALFATAPLLLLGLMRGSMPVFVLALAPALVSARPQFLPNASLLLHLMPAVLRTSRGRTRFLRRFGVHLFAWLGFGVSVGVAIGFAYGWTYGLSMGLIAGLTMGLIVGLGFSLADAVTSVTQPSSVIWYNVYYCTAIGIGGGIAAGLYVTLANSKLADRAWAGIGYGAAAALAFSVAVIVLGYRLGFGNTPTRQRGAGGMFIALGGMVGGLASGLVHGIAGGLAIGTAVGLALMLNYGGFHWLRYAIANRSCARRGLMPAHPARFLDWAYDAGLLRLSGAAIQFRHRELQEWLLRRP